MIHFFVTKLNRKVVAQSFGVIVWRHCWDNYASSATVRPGFCSYIRWYFVPIFTFVPIFVGIHIITCELSLVVYLHLAVLYSPCTLTPIRVHVPRAVKECKFLLISKLPSKSNVS